MTKTDISGMPSTIISVMLSFNEYYQLGYSRDKLLRGDALAHADDWILSKNFTQQEIDAKIGSLSFSNFASEEIQDHESEVSKKLTAALEKENLTKGWTPAPNTRIALIHHKDDIIVPYVNQTNLYNFRSSKMDSNDITQVTCGDIKWMDDMPAHENGAVDFALRIFEILTTEYDFPFWLINEDTVKKLLDDALEEWYKSLMGEAA